MDFRKELAKELGIGAIAENTMLDDYVKACEAIAIRYHNCKVKELNIPDVVGSLSLIGFIEEIEYMIKLYGNQRYTQAEEQRDKLSEKLDDMMRIGGN